jgi:hypothetical protein
MQEIEQCREQLPKERKGNRFITARLVKIEIFPVGASLLVPGD